MKFLFLSTLVGCLLAAAVVDSFVPLSTTQIGGRGHGIHHNSVILSSSATDETSSSGGNTVAATKLLKGDRYIASNRFSVRRGKEAKFEQRWANRKSRLAELDGFRYFHLMRRVTLDDETTTSYDQGKNKDDAFGNYVSLTVWDTKGNFNAWRKGDAFREAHGGTSVGAFVSTMVSSIRVLRGAPKPAFYDGLLVQSTTPEFLPETVDGWRNVQFPDGGGTLPAECFVACNQFYVPRENAVAFEQRWKNRESKLKFCEGFVAFSMMRRDTKQKGHGTVEMDESSEPTYVSTTIWKDRASFEAWRKGSNFSKVHGKKPEDTKGEDKEEAPKKPPQPLWSRPPTPIFYEGTLVISTADGA